LSSRWIRCYLITVPRLLVLLLMFALTLGNGVAVAAAICQHPDARAHAAALHSPDAAVAAVALNEDTAAGSEQEGTLADGSAASLLGFVLPPEPGLVLRTPEAASPPMAATMRLASRSSPPLLEPPLV
jgi:hypothetical protein